MPALPARVLIYSHDTFGLGHLRRCRALAGALTAAYPNLSVLILSGSPIIGAFEFPERVDFVRVPGIIKLRDGGYRPTKLPAVDAFRMRSEIIEQAALVFAPDLVIVDKEPLGLRGELTQTLKALKRGGAKLVLGLRDVLDDAEALDTEWHRKRVGPALATLYDEIWIYGVEDIYDPLTGISLAAGLREKTHYMGYLKRDPLPGRGRVALPPEPYVLVTPGGGGDGDALIDWALSAYEAHGARLPNAAFVLGPFMEPQARDAFLDRAAAIPNIMCSVFEPEMERVIERASAVVGMGGYNTFCEILSFDKPAALMPRERPRREQWIRAHRAQELGLMRLIEDPAEKGRPRTPAAMATVLAEVMHQPKPSARFTPGLMDGLDRVVDFAGRLLRR